MADQFLPLQNITKNITDNINNLLLMVTTALYPVLCMTRLIKGLLDQVLLVSLGCKSAVKEVPIIQLTCKMQLADDPCFNLGVKKVKGQGCMTSGIISK